jgi:hypothetical protein
MSINIKNREVEALLAELKSATGLGTSRIVLTLLRQEAERLRRRNNRDKALAEIDAIACKASAIANRALSDDELVGYGEDGLPR